MYGERLARWERAFEWPLMIAAGLFLLAYTTQILSRPDGIEGTIAGVIVWVTWGVFLTDYVVRLMIAENRWRWFYRHILDLALVLLPMLRPLQLLRFFTVIAIIQRNAGTKLRGKVFVYTLGTTALTIFLAALAVFSAEEGSGGPIRSFGDAVWWAFVSITTVGYGDYFPVTTTGRVVAVGLMIGGIALIGVVTATLASWIVDRVSVESEQAATATSAQVERLHGEISHLRGELGEMKELLQALNSAR